MIARISAFAIWAFVAATAVFWGLRLLVHAPAAPANAVAVGDASAVRGDLTRLLGAAPVAAPVALAAPPASSRFRLFGIMAPRYAAGTLPPTRGVALIAVDGKMPKAYEVGSRLDADLVLKSVSLRTVSIATAQGASAITLELPPLPPAATGTLPLGSIGGFVPPPPAGIVVPQYIPQPALRPNVQAPFEPAPQPPAPVAPRGESNAPTQ